MDKRLLLDVVGPSGPDIETGLGIGVILLVVIITAVLVGSLSYVFKKVKQDTAQSIEEYDKEADEQSDED